jgi:hypothetical protein
LDKNVTVLKRKDRSKPYGPTNRRVVFSKALLSKAPVRWLAKKAFFLEAPSGDLDMAVPEPRDLLGEVYLDLFERISGEQHCLLSVKAAQVDRNPAQTVFLIELA